MPIGQQYLELSPYLAEELLRINRAAQSSYWYAWSGDLALRTHERRVFDKAFFSQVRLLDWPQEALTILYRAEAE